MYHIVVHQFTLLELHYVITLRSELRVEAQFVVMPQAIPGLEDLATANTVEASGVDVDGFHVGHDVLF